MARAMTAAAATSRGPPRISAGRSSAATSSPAAAAKRSAGQRLFAVVAPGPVEDLVQVRVGRQQVPVLLRNGHVQRGVRKAPPQRAERRGGQQAIADVNPSQDQDAADPPVPSSPVQQASLPLSIKELT